jgi:alpha-glucosidase
MIIKRTILHLTACRKMGWQPLTQRLRDKYHRWEDLELLIPHMIAEGLAGYTFSCPDMTGC